MTHTLPQIKALIKEFKSVHCPRLGQKKSVLQAFAEKHGLLKHLDESPAAVKEAVNEVVPAPAPIKAKKEAKN